MCRESLRNSKEGTTRKAKTVDISPAEADLGGHDPTVGCRYEVSKLFKIRGSSGMDVRRKECMAAGLGIPQHVLKHPQGPISGFLPSF